MLYVTLLYVICDIVCTYPLYYISIYLVILDYPPVRSDDQLIFRVPLSDVLYDNSNTNKQLFVNDNTVSATNGQHEQVNCAYDDPVIDETTQSNVLSLRVVHTQVGDSAKEEPIQDVDDTISNSIRAKSSSNLARQDTRVASSGNTEEVMSCAGDIDNSTSDVDADDGTFSTVSVCDSRRSSLVLLTDSESEDICKVLRRDLTIYHAEGTHTVSCRYYCIVGNAG